MNPQSGRPTTSPNLINDLVRYFQRSPFLAGKSLAPDAQVQPIMDLSLEWPLRPQTIRKDFTATAGTNQIVLVDPPKEQHVIVAYGLFFTPTPLATQSIHLFMQEEGTPSGITGIDLEVFQLAANRNQIPLVNSHVINADGVFLEGVGAVYVPGSHQLVFALTGAAGGEVCQLRILTYTFPATQPLNNLIEF
jgi:hypothetical protein